MKISHFVLSGIRMATCNCWVKSSLRIILLLRLVLMWFTCNPISKRSRKRRQTSLPSILFYRTPTWNCSAGHRNKYWFWLGVSASTASPMKISRFYKMQLFNWWEAMFKPISSTWPTKLCTTWRWYPGFMWSISKLIGF